MNLFCQSVSFRDCPASAGEKLVLDKERQRNFLYNCRDYPQISDALVLNTCYRLEFYFYAKKCFDVSAFVDDFVSHNYWNEYKQTFYGLDVAEHLFSVAAGLESQIIGENEIFSQLKAAYSFALRCKTVNTMFHHLLHSAFRVAKAVRTHTDINTGALSIAQAAVELAAANVAIENAKVFIIGSGTNAELVAKHLIRKNVTDITIAARNRIAAGQLIQKAAGQFLPLNELENNLSDADIVFAAASSPQPLLTAKSILRKRTKPLLLIDLSVPPNIESEVEKLDNMKLFNIDSLKEIINANNLNRKNEIPKAQAIIDRHLQIFSKWLEDLNIVPLVAQKVGK
ncbi:MAG: glutamyl-tRNA reductase [Phycisphaerae bacterium]|nr:glutamyl-tRNA reductase [Phycisphaerae bacterium]